MDRFVGSSPEELLPLFAEEYGIENAQMVGEPYATKDKIISVYEPSADDELRKGDILFAINSSDEGPMTGHIDAANVVKAGNGNRLKGILRIISHFSSMSPDEIFEDDTFFS